LKNKIRASCIFTLGLLLVCFAVLRSEAQPLQGSSEADQDSLAQTEALNHYLNGTVHEEADEVHQALVEYQLALLFDEESATIRIAIARLYSNLGHRRAAMLLLEKGRRLNPHDEELLKTLADYYIRFNRQDDAADCYKDLAALRELDRHELLKMAAILTACGRTDEALAAYAEALDRFGPDIDVYHKIGLIHLLHRDVEAAETTYHRLVELDPSQDRVYFVLGGFAISRQDWASAEVNFRKALELDSSDVKYWMNLLLTLNAQHKTSEELAVSGAALARFRDMPQLYDIRGRALQQVNRFDEALACADSSLALDSARLSPYMIKGYVYHEQGEFFKAAAAYEQALKIDSENATLLNNYAYMLSEQNYRLEDGLSMVDKALKIRPGESSFLDTRAWLLYRLGRFKPALDEIKDALKNDGDNAELYEHLGYIYMALGKTAKSKKAWKRANELEPDNEKYQRLVH